MRMRGHDFHCNPARSREEPATVRLLGWRMVSWSRLSEEFLARLRANDHGAQDTEIGGCPFREGTNGALVVRGWQPRSIAASARTWHPWRSRSRSSWWPSRVPSRRSVAMTWSQGWYEGRGGCRFCSAEKQRTSASPLRSWTGGRKEPSRHIEATSIFLPATGGSHEKTRASGFCDNPDPLGPCCSS